MLTCVIRTWRGGGHTAIGLVLAVGLGTGGAVHQLVAGTSTADALPLLSRTVGILIGARGRQAHGTVALRRTSSWEVGGVERGGGSKGGQGQKTSSRGEAHLDGGVVDGLKIRITWIWSEGAVCDGLLGDYPLRSASPYVRPPLCSVVMTISPDMSTIVRSAPMQRQHSLLWRVVGQAHFATSCRLVSQVSTEQAFQGRTVYFQGLHPCRHARGRAGNAGRPPVIAGRLPQRPWHSGRLVRLRGEILVQSTLEKVKLEVSSLRSRDSRPH